MRTLNQAQIKLLVNFCSDIAKGAMLSGLGFAFTLPSDPNSKALIVIPSMIATAIFLIFAFIFAKFIQE